MSDNRTKTNRDTEQKDKLVERLVAINRVTKVTKGGRTFTFAAIVVVGDEEGRIGFGLGLVKYPQLSRRVVLLLAATSSRSPSTRVRSLTNSPHPSVVLASSSSPLLPVLGLRLGVLCVPSWKVSA